MGCCVSSRSGHRRRRRLRRIAGKPAATLLHLGPGLGNGLANLHNARRAHVPVVNVIGDHATYHKSTTRHWNPTSNHWPTGPTVGPGAPPRVRRWAATPRKGGRVAATPARIANLILPADVSWDEGAEASGPVAPKPAAAPDPKAVNGSPMCCDRGADRALDRGPATGVDGLGAADRIAAATGARVLVETFPTRLTRGAGVPAADRLGYLAEQAAFQLDGIKHLIVAGTRAPVSFFAYPGKQSVLTPEGSGGAHAGRFGHRRGRRTATAGRGARTGTSPRPADAAPPELPSGS